jgi:hypothetical protein
MAVDTVDSDGEGRATVSEENGRTSLGACPSAPLANASSVLGAITANGTVAYISPSIPLSKSLIDALRVAGVHIENRIRFTGPCMGSQCVQWSGRGCGLVDAIVSQPIVDSAARAVLPHCGIRATCRWYAQHKSAACEQCSMVLHEPLLDEVRGSDHPEEIGNRNALQT